MDAPGDRFIIDPTHQSVHMSSHPMGYSGSTSLCEGTIGFVYVIFKHWGPVLDKKYLPGLIRGLSDWEQVSPHKHILPFIGLLESTGSLELPSLVLLHMHGNIMEYLGEKPDVDILLLVYQVALGLKHLHHRQPGIVHGNIKGSNILINSNGHVFLSDIAVHRELFTSGVLGSNARWSAPELVPNEQVEAGLHYTLAADIWSFAMTLLEVYSRARPYQTIPHTVTVFLAMANQQIPAQPECLASALYDNLW